MNPIPTTHSNPQADEERLLVERAKAGDADAFAELVRRSAQSSRRLALSVLKNQDAAEDALQDAFSQAWEHVPRFLGESKFSTWISRIVFNQCLMYLRKGKRVSFVALDESPQEESRPFLQLQSQTPTPEQGLGQKEVVAVVRKEVERLPKLLREPLILRDLQQLPLETVASRLQISVAATKSRLLRARSELRVRLERHCGRAGIATLA
ncbi:MAG: sigma-70 family RNA polymerase sigma factor [Bryobacterales bacterium]|nr:sigma-70 family RNA polymerase sigma factor [Bryobacterales bacterium]